MVSKINLLKELALKNINGTIFGGHLLCYFPAREDLNPISVFENQDHPQRVAVEMCPPGSVMVIGHKRVIWINKNIYETSRKVASG